MVTSTWMHRLLLVWAVVALSVSEAFSPSSQSFYGFSKTLPVVKTVKTSPYLSSWAPSFPNSRIQHVIQPLSSRAARSKQRLTASSVNSFQDGDNKSSGWRKLIPSSKSKDVTALLSASTLVLLDVAFRQGFRHYAISFPSSLAGCGALLATLLVSPPKLASRLYDALSPGSRLLAKWLSVFFVPSLITLPLLTGGAGSATELAKVGLVVVGGFYFSLMSTAWSVVAVRNFVEKRTREVEANDGSAIVSSSPPTFEQPAPPTPQPAGFSDQLHNRLLAASLVSGAATLLLSKFATRLEPYVSSVFFLWTTLYTFVWGARLPKKVTKLVHPLVTCTALTWAASYGLAVLTSRPWKSILTSYRRGGGGAVTAFLHPGVGAGDILLFLLGPAVLSLACQMYERRELVKSNAAAVATGVAVGSVGGLLGTATAVRLLQIGNPYMRLSLLSRNITSPLAMAMAAMLGANVSLAVAFVVVTGLLGANFGAALLDAHGVEDEIARGMAMGAASHGLGTAAMVNEKLAFPFSAISMAMTASVCTVLVSIPLVQRIILQLALGW